MAAPCIRCAWRPSDAAATTCPGRRWRALRPRASATARRTCARCRRAWRRPSTAAARRRRWPAARRTGWPARPAPRSGSAAAATAAWIPVPCPTTSAPRRCSRASGLRRPRRRGTVSLDPRTLPYHLRHQALFAGYAPAEHPTIALVVVVEHGGYGGSTAAPIARKIFDAWLLGAVPEPIAVADGVAVPPVDLFEDVVGSAFPGPGAQLLEPVAVDPPAFDVAPPGAAVEPRP